MSNKEPFSRKDCRKARNLAMFWEVRRDGLTQDEVAAKYGVSQQRVSAILRRMALYVALAPSKEYENIPQLGQMQYTYRIWLERMEQRRGDVHRAFLKSMEMQTTVKKLDAGKQMSGEPFFSLPVVEAKADGDAKPGAQPADAQPAKPARSPGKGSYTQWKQESIGKTQHGDWRLDKMLERIDQSISETRLVLYGRNWHGWELLEKSEMTRSGGAKRKKRSKRKSNDELQMSKEDRKTKPEVESEPAVVSSVAVSVAEPVVGSVAEAALAPVVVPSTEYSVPSTEPIEAAANEPAVAVEIKLTDSAPPSTLAPPPSGGSALPPHPARRVRPPAISKITGKRIEAPALKTPEFLREHGLDPADYNGGRSDDTGPVWITGPDPEEVLSRDISKMTDEDYVQYLKDIAFLKAYGSYREPDRRKSIVMYDNHYYR